MLVTALVLTFLAGAGAGAQQITPELALERLFVADEIESAWFSPVVLAQLSPADVEEIILQLTPGLGQFRGVQAEMPPNYNVVFDNGTIPAQIVLDEQARIMGLWFGPPQPTVDDSADIIEAFAALPGTTSVFAMVDGQPVLTHNASEPLAVGSTFKLAVLTTLLSEINQGLRDWSDVVHLEEQSRSLPSGMMQDWPVGAPVTLHTLAAMMISISDNTATDTLMHLLGREQVGVFTPRNDPFLTTRELFVLKNPDNREVLDEFLTADREGRHELLDELATLPMIQPEQFVGPIAPAVEWFFTAEETCMLMGFVHELPLMGINPGLANPADWSTVAFKGGSEPGVLNYTTWLTDDAGHSYCVSATWNDDDSLDEIAFAGLYTSLLEEMKQFAGTTP